MMTKSKNNRYTTVVFPAAWSGSDAYSSTYKEEGEKGNEKLRKFLDDGFVVSHLSTFVIQNVAYAYYFLEKNED